jgi:hypothetical protein
MDGTVLHMADSANYDGGVIRWEEPPAIVEPQQNRRPWSLVAAQLRARPNASALIDDQSNVSLAPRINAGKAWWGPRGTFEATSRWVNGRIYTYAWYVGEPADDNTRKR